MFSVLPLSRRQLVEESSKVGDLVLGTVVENFSNEKMKVFLGIINIVVNVNDPHGIVRLVWLSNVATTCTCSLIKAN